MKDFTHPKFPTIHIKLLTTTDDLEQLETLLEPFSVSRDTITAFIPEPRSKDNKYLYGIFDNDTLIGAIDLIEDYPAVESSYIHQFILSEDYQTNNLPETLYLSLEKTAQETGTTLMHLNEQLNSDFWNNQGFEAHKKEI
ncbi:GNAT family N-acetyltransferase [Vagococcus carniphilus]|uniref:GNAT family N-acetyltransferase n=1 Tax=Vagococcus carniphilus TaxID=218144 RepID=UPI00288F5D51|nr:GNAT family N-acetyltransferase [Vagococcus carniphilus]MDT2829956.1 GNAT family N-acetyltransferase [Vagococcus carniphilus]MDT2838391.1 GNAT family N-acetyltransferase [Vagococcus carniphilus]MDT2854387.1 GNAT family N-acetyltransferase [Vagococcus carniphilus]